mmetsp:Transcript_27262/g.63873  ORF Transcript_27262/g.63873 Transcript_27262/m.63873 type:complete len:86 (+) Transcript_27262:2090-2347(+)
MYGQKEYVLYSMIPSTKQEILVARVCQRIVVVINRESMVFCFTSNYQPTNLPSSTALVPVFQKSTTNWAFHPEHRQRRLLVMIVY